MAPLEKASIPNDPVPLQISRTLQLSIFILYLFEVIIEKRDSFNLSDVGLILVPFGGRSFNPLYLPYIVSIDVASNSIKFL